MSHSLGAMTKAMAPASRQMALDNGLSGSILKDYVAPPPQNIQKQIKSLNSAVTFSIMYVD